MKPNKLFLDNMSSAWVPPPLSPLADEEGDFSDRLLSMMTNQKEKEEKIRCWQTLWLNSTSLFFFSWSHISCQVEFSIARLLFGLCQQNPDESVCGGEAFFFQLVAKCASAGLLWQFSNVEKCLVVYCRSLFRSNRAAERCCFHLGLSRSLPAPSLQKQVEGATMHQSGSEQSFQAFVEKAVNRGLNVLRFTNLFQR